MVAKGMRNSHNERISKEKISLYNLLCDPGTFQNVAVQNVALKCENW